MFPGSIVVDIANAENRVQNPKMTRIHDFPFSPTTFCRVVPLQARDVQCVAEKRLNLGRFGVKLLVILEPVSKLCHYGFCIGTIGYRVASPAGVTGGLNRVLRSITP
jgi:hypothetical protein